MPEPFNHLIPSLSKLPGFFLRPVPMAVYDPVLKFMMNHIQKKHPQLFDRMEEYADRLILMDPTDMPFVIVLQPDPLMPEIHAYRSANDCLYDASITGSFHTFMEMLEGRQDGDALFFSRNLTIGGDTECVVALRNTLDDAELDVFGDIAEALGPLGPFFQGARNAAKSLHEKIAA